MPKASPEAGAHTFRCASAVACGKPLRVYDFLELVLKFSSKIFLSRTEVK
ncbi:MAG: hypothetical protein RM338_20975 [Nostoc sp. DedQUE12a]|nr:hypothetical protein [Nostoc sp. DedQUE12a]